MQDRTTWHRLNYINITLRMATCSICGKNTPISKHGPDWVCSKSKQLYKARHRIENRKYDKEFSKRYPEKALYRHAKTRAKKYNIIFTITLKNIHIPSFCPILGIALYRSAGSNKDHLPSIDRIIPEKGYTAENIQIISWLANRLKANRGAEDHAQIAKRYYRLARIHHQIAKYLKHILN